MYKILIYGGKHYIQELLLDSMHNMGIVNLKVSQKTYTLPNEIYNEIIEYQPTHILCMINKNSEMSDLYKNKDMTKNPKNTNDEIYNSLYTPILLANISRELGIHFTYVNICNFFNYDQTQPLRGFEENDYPNFSNNTYSMINGYTDVILRTYSNVLNLRIQNPICYLSSDEDNDFLAELCKQTEIYDIVESYTVLDDILPILLDMSLQKKTGTYNLANPGYMSHQEIMELYKLEFDTSHSYTIKPYSEYIQKNNNTIPHCILNTSKLSDLYPDIPDIKKAIQVVLRRSI